MYCNQHSTHLGTTGKMLGTCSLLYKLTNVGVNAVHLYVRTFWSQCAVFYLCTQIYQAMIEDEEVPEPSDSTQLAQLVSDV